jgi:Tol biopolymer transport system component/predicted Ser/Thr protein kinase
MNLMGRTIGNYQIREELGRGGMAVVYRAYQQSLNRYVAIKVLPPQLAFDQEFVERFQREARAAAGLRHPNIVVIHDVGQEEGIYYIVMEYLEGRTLKQVIEQQGPLPPKRAGRIIEQVASALDYAHKRGFVHRDVKPANIFVGEGDRVTLTDFGIAKAGAETQHLTRTGMLMGTPEYMSPEQATGGMMDHRTDLYALGVVLYQMLVGRVPFRGTTPHAVLHAVIYEPPPPPRQINPNLPPAIEAVIMKAVAKRPEQRFQRGAEMVAALRAALVATGGGPQHAPAAVPPPPGPGPARVAPAASLRSALADSKRGSRSAAQPIGSLFKGKGSPVVWIMAGIALVLLLSLGGLILLLGGGGGQETPVPATIQAVVWMATAATPTAARPGASVWQPTETSQPAPATKEAIPTQVQSSAAAPPPATDTPTAAPPATDTPTAVAPPTETPTPAPAVPGADAPAGRLAFSSNRDGKPEIYVVSFPGGSPVRLTNNKANDWLPDWSPDGGRIAFTSDRTGSYDLWVMNGDGSGQTAWVTTAAWDDYARWAPDGRRLSFSTTANTEGVPNSEIFVRQTDGSLVQLTYSTAEDQWADWSPDGRIVYSEGYKDDSNWDIYIMNGDGSGRMAWLGGATCDVQPTWSPDGQRIAFLRISADSNGNGRVDFEDAGDVWVGQASGGGLRQLTSGFWAAVPSWSPDSQWLAFTRLSDSNGNGRSDEGDDADIWAVPVGGGTPVPLVQGPSRDGDASWTSR